jgi:hypothetical protein
MELRPRCPAHGASGNLGAGMPTQDRPPSAVLTTEVHGWCAHGAVPRTQPSLADTKVIDTGRKPGGTGPPAGPGTGAGVTPAVPPPPVAAPATVATASTPAPASATPAAAIRARPAVPASRRGERAGSCMASPLCETVVGLCTC